jgi:hypothetical protein
VDTTAVQSAIPTPTWVFVYTPETRQSGEVTYRYRISNQGTNPLAEIQIGIALSLEEPQLSEAPIGWDPETNNCPPSIEVPRGWTGCIGRQEESDRIYLIFAAKGDSAHLQPGSGLSVAVTVARRDPTYSGARFLALSTAFPNYEGNVTTILACPLPDHMKRPAPEDEP